jgi:hypothetical protein
VAFGLLAAVSFFMILHLTGLPERVRAAAGLPTEVYVAATNGLLFVGRIVSLVLLIWAVMADRKPDEAP